MNSILFLSLMNSDAWGGSEEIWYKAALSLAKKKYYVGVGCFNWPGKENKIDELKRAGCTIYLLPGRHETRSLFGKLKLRNKLKEIQFKQFDHVIVSQGGWKDVAHGPFKVLWKKLPVYSLIFHNYNSVEKVSSEKLRLLSDWVNHANANIGAATRIFSALNEAYKVEFPRQYVLFNPITFSPPTNATPFPSLNNKIVLTSLAALDIERKAQDILIKTIASDKWKKRNWKMNFYGRGKDEQLLKDLIKENGLESKVTLHGHTSNVMQVLKDTHLILQITRLDAMPISVVEAMAMARPVVVSDVGDMPLWVDERTNGWIVKEVNAENIDKTLEKAWAEKERWEEMGSQSFNVFQKKYPSQPELYFLKLTGIIS